jgi:putative RecB family exonuclease
MAKSSRDLSDLLPEAFSPSRLSEFSKCPTKFFFSTICKLPSKATTATTKGTLAHYAFEKIFDLARGERSEERCIPLVREHWEDIKDEDNYTNVVALGADAVEAMLQAAEQFVRNWFMIEKPWVFDPVGREQWVRGNVGTLPMRGIIDRLDKVEREGVDYWCISDYKTGRVPGPQYQTDAFFGLNVYSVLLEEDQKVRAGLLRLVYVTNGRREDVLSQEVGEASLARTKKKVSDLGVNIRKAATKGVFNPHTSRLCDYCDYKPICPAFHPELVGLGVDEIRDSVGVNLKIQSIEKPVNIEPEVLPLEHWGDGNEGLGVAIEESEGGGADT